MLWFLQKEIVILPSANPTLRIIKTICDISDKNDKIPGIHDSYF